MKPHLAVTVNSNVVGAGHARDIEATILPLIACMARSYSIDRNNP